MHKESGDAAALNLCVSVALELGGKAMLVDGQERVIETLQGKVEHLEGTLDEARRLLDLAHRLLHHPKGLPAYELHYTETVAERWRQFHVGYARDLEER